MESIWFRNSSWTYIPINFMGIAVTLLAAVFLVPVYAAIFSTGHSVSDNLTRYFFTPPALLFGGSGLQKKQVYKLHGKNYFQ